MKKEYDINQIKSLLGAYYDGVTTIEQEKLLCDFFATASNIPPELEPDRQLFVELHEMENNKINIPVDLESKLILHIDNLEKAEIKKRFNWVKPFSFLSVAASIIAIFVIGYYFISSDEIIIEQNKPIAKIKTEANDIEGNNTPQISPDSNDSDNKSIEEQAKNKELTYSANTNKTVKIKSNRTKHIKGQQSPTSQHKPVSEEQLAYENTEKALLMLSKNLNKAQEGLDKTKATINNVNNTITDII